ncbi:MAG: type 4a pilus biogenesis protein PilO, partial [Acidobacteria bacterium]|nr:type 4a pilus biogenesis protein PilO [Acidobacteriota bacterium]
MTLTTHIPPWLERMGIPLALGGLVLALGWYLFVSGYGAEIELQRQQLDALSRELGQGAELEQQLEDRSSRNRRLASQLASLEAALPEEATATRLLRQLQEAAVESGLKVKSIRKMPAQEGETFSREPYGLALAGAYHDLGGFCGKLAGLAPIVSLEDLRISAAGLEDSPHTLIADLTAVVHRYRPAAAAVEAPVDPAQPARQATLRYRVRGRRDPFRLPQAPASAPPGVAAAGRPRGLKGQGIWELQL